MRDRRTGERYEPRPGAGAALEQAAERVGRRALVAWLGVAVFGVALTAVVGLLGPDRSSDARALEVAAEQRVLSQRLVRAAALTATGDADARQRLADSWDEFAAGHDALRTGDGSLGIHRTPHPALVAVYADAGGLDDQVAALGEHVAVLLDTGTEAAGTASPSAVAERRTRAASTIVAAAAGPLLAGLDEAMIIDRDVAARRDRAATLLAWVGLVLFAAAIITTGIVLHRPLVRELRRSAGVAHGLEREAARSADWQRRFATIAAHELRTPVTVVAGLTAMLMARWDEVDDSLRRDVMARVAAQGQNMTTLVEELSLTAGLISTPVSSDPWSLDEIVDALVDSHDLVVEVPAATVVTVDRRRLELVLRELVDNAYAHGRPPVSAVVDTTASGAVVVEVGDGGPGAPRHEVPHLLEPFTRAADVDNHRSADGRGIGLAVVAGIAAEVGGRVHQRITTHGCTWIVTFPDATVDSDG